jgi:hypothetical protein
MPGLSSVGSGVDKARIGRGISLSRVQSRGAACLSQTKADGVSCGDDQATHDQTSDRLTLSAGGGLSQDRQGRPHGESRVGLHDHQAGDAVTDAIPP